MRYIIYFFTSIAVACFFVGCKHPNYSAEANLPAREDQENFKYSIIRYVGKKPKHATDSTKFETRFDEAYKELSRISYLDKYYINPKDGYLYFEIRRLAPSMETPLYVATGGRLKYGAQDSIVEYEEIYRTWKMPVDKLAKKTAIFFHDMVNGKDLSPYYTDNIDDTEHIEFPDKHNRYNKELRRWEYK